MERVLLSQRRPILREWPDASHRQVAERRKMVSNNPPKGRYPEQSGDSDGPRKPNGLRRGFPIGQPTQLPTGLPPLVGKPLPPIKPTKHIASSQDGDQFITEQPSLSQGPNDNPRQQDDSKPSPKDSRPQNSKADNSGKPDNTGKSGKSNNTPSPSSSPKLRLVGRHPDRPANTSRPSPRSKPTASDLTRGYNARTPFGSSEPAASSMAASGVMLDLTPVGQPIDSASDPRWVLALRTAEALQGSVLPPEQRQKLIRLGKVMGMTAFDANLVIAIIQDQARRGYAADYCPTAGEPQLQMVPLPRLTSVIHNFPGRRALMLACAIAAVLATEVVFFNWWLG